MRVDDFEDDCARSDFRRWWRVWGWGGIDEGENRLFDRWKASRIRKACHRPKRGRFAGWRGR